MSVTIYSVFSPPPADGIDFKDLSLTQQHFKDEVDINTIMRRYQSTGILGDPLNPGTARPMFDDFSYDFDYQAALNLLIDADARFAALPADLRRRFGNDPAALLHFLGDPANKDEAVKLGLVDLPVSPVDSAVVPAPKAEV